MKEERWAILLAHHRPDRYDRCLALPIRSPPVRLCARCTGQALGVVLLLAIALAAPLDLERLLVLPAAALVALAPIPATVDWTGQAIGRWESTNPRRVATGALLGFAWADLLGALIVRPWPSVLALGVVVAYGAAIVVVLVRAGALERIVAERFPERRGAR